jgi:hypothetical protein
MAACYVAILFGFGSLWLYYVGTFLSEVPATFWCMLSLYGLVGNEIDLTQTAVTRRHYCRLLGSGLALGVAIATHITAILFVPFFFAYAIYPFLKKTRSFGIAISASAVWGIGVAILLVLLGYYNFTRFGNVLETGRTVDPSDVERFSYGIFVIPWRGFLGMLIGGNKGMLWYCPAAVASILLCRPFFRRYRFLTVVIFAASLFRLLFIASRSDWHGGFCLGPRYLVMIVPFLILPLGEIVAKWLRDRNMIAIWSFRVFSILCVVATIYVGLCDAVHYYTCFFKSGLSQGFDVYKYDWLYVSWQACVLPSILDGWLRPWVLRTIEIDAYTLFACLASFVSVLLLLIYMSALTPPLSSSSRLKTVDVDRTSGARSSGRDVEKLAGQRRTKK